MQPDDFADRRSDALIDRYQDALTRIRAQWPGGTLVFPDPNELALWVLPTNPLETDMVTYQDVLERLRTTSHWAVIAPDNETVHRITRPYISGQLHFYVGSDETWVLHHP